MNDISIWLERLASLYKSQMRQAVSAEGVQLVHLEILQYLAMSNRYSNTAQALTEYLGQTKGSISQSLKLLEKSGFVERKASQKDKRVMHLFLTDKGQASLERMSVYLMPKLGEQAHSADSIRELLQSWQNKNQQQGFGQCQSCRFHQKLSKEQFQCGLTGEPLTWVESKKICREHEFGEEKSTSTN